MEILRIVSKIPQSITATGLIPEGTNYLLKSQKRSFSASVAKSEDKYFPQPDSGRAEYYSKRTSPDNPTAIIFDQDHGPLSV